jgi:hypothetical protein
MSAQRILESHPGDLDARYYLGSVEAIRGAYAITVGSTLFGTAR